MPDRVQGPVPRELIEKMPKAELHLHMEGAIPIETLYAFAQTKGVPGVGNQDDVKRRLAYANFDEFIRVWLWTNTFIRSEGDFEEIAYSVLRSLSKQNVRYVEAFYSPGNYLEYGLTSQGITESMISGKRRAEREFGIRCELIVDLIRDMGPAYGMGLVKELEPYLGRGLIGVGLGGSEDRFPADAYELVYAEARKRGYRLTAHAGEVAGAPSIWAAIKKLGAERIGHGLRADEDEGLVSYLRESQTPLEMCPTSNVKTRVCGSLSSHPIRRYFDQGLRVTLNSDDPTMFDTTITKEYSTLGDTFHFTWDELKRIALNAVEGSFMSEAEKDSTGRDFEKQFDRLETAEPSLN